MCTKYNPTQISLNFVQICDTKNYTISTNTNKNRCIVLFTYHCLNPLPSAQAQLQVLLPPLVASHLLQAFLLQSPLLDYLQSYLQFSLLLACPQLFLPPFLQTSLQVSLQAALRASLQAALRASLQQAQEELPGSKIKYRKKI